LKVLLIDFYDSFTYNIYHYLVSLGANVTVWEDRVVKIEEIEQFDAIILSPGPGLPKDSVSLFPVLERYSTKKKILGVCLGMQGIAEFYGSKLYNQPEIRHGISSKMRILKNDKLFTNLPQEIEVGLYHSWAVNLDNNSELILTSTLENNVVMGIEHYRFPVFGIQFHPESILTPCGKQILDNFLNNC